MTLLAKLGITPGPWKYYKQSAHSGSNHGYRVETYHTEIDIAHIYEPAEANARLIAQAPAMLFLMVAMVDSAKSINMIKGAKVLDLMAEVIESATGKTCEEIVEMMETPTTGE